MTGGDFELTWIGFLCMQNTASFSKIYKFETLFMSTWFQIYGQELFWLSGG